jgi:hypothetical protein
MMVEGEHRIAVDDIYDTCDAFMACGVTINRPPRDGRMAFIRTPDGISIELLQAGGALPFFARAVSNLGRSGLAHPRGPQAQARART